MNKKTTVGWDVTPGILTGRYGVGMMCCLHLQRRQISYTAKGRERNESSIQVSNIPIKTSVVTTYRLLCWSVNAWMSPYGRPLKLAAAGHNDSDGEQTHGTVVKVL